MGLLSKVTKRLRKFGGTVLPVARKALKFVEKKALPIGEKLTGKLGQNLLTGIEFIDPLLVPEIETAKFGLRKAHGLIERSQNVIKKGREVEKRIHPFLKTVN